MLEITWAIVVVVFIFLIVFFGVIVFFVTRPSDYWAVEDEHYPTDDCEQ